MVTPRKPGAVRGRPPKAATSRAVEAVRNSGGNSGDVATLATVAGVHRTTLERALAKLAPSSPSEGAPTWAGLATPADRADAVSFVAGGLATRRIAPGAANALLTAVRTSAGLGGEDGYSRAEVAQLLRRVVAVLSPWPNAYQAARRALAVELGEEEAAEAAPIVASTEDSAPPPAPEAPPERVTMPVDTTTALTFIMTRRGAPEHVAPVVEAPAPIEPAGPAVEPPPPAKPKATDFRCNWCGEIRFIGAIGTHADHCPSREWCLGRGVEYKPEPCTLGPVARPVADPSRATPRVLRGW